MDSENSEHFIHPPTNENSREGIQIPFYKQPPACAFSSIYYITRRVDTYTMSGASKKTPGTTGPQKMPGIPAYLKKLRLACPTVFPYG